MMLAKLMYSPCATASSRVMRMVGCCCSSMGRRYRTAGVEIPFYYSVIHSSAMWLCRGKSRTMYVVDRRRGPPSSLPMKRAEPATASAETEIWTGPSHSSTSSMRASQKSATSPTIAPPVNVTHFHLVTPCRLESVNSKVSDGSSRIAIPSPSDNGSATLLFKPSPVISSDITPLPSEIFWIFVLAPALPHPDERPLVENPNDQFLWPIAAPPAARP